MVFKYNDDSMSTALFPSLSSGGAGVLAARGQIYMGAPIRVLEIHLRAKFPPPRPHPFAPPLSLSFVIHDDLLCKIISIVCYYIYMYLLLYVFLFFYIL